MTKRLSNSSPWESRALSHQATPFLRRSDHETPLLNKPSTISRRFSEHKPQQTWVKFTLKLFAEFKKQDVLFLASSWTTNNKSVRECLVRKDHRFIAKVQKFTSQNSEFGWFFPNKTTNWGGFMWDHYDFPKIEIIPVHSNFQYFSLLPKLRKLSHQVICCQGTSAVDKCWNAGGSIPSGTCFPRSIPISTAERATTKRVVAKSFSRQGMSEDNRSDAKLHAAMCSCKNASSPLMSTFSPSGFTPVEARVLVSCSEGSSLRCLVISVSNTEACVLLWAHPLST